MAEVAQQLRGHWNDIGVLPLYQAHSALPAHIDGLEQEMMLGEMQALPPIAWRNEVLRMMAESEDLVRAQAVTIDFTLNAAIFRMRARAGRM